MISGLSDQQLWKLIWVDFAQILQNTREAFAREEEEREAARLAAAARLEEERCAEADRAQQAQLIKAAKVVDPSLDL